MNSHIYSRGSLQSLMNKQIEIDDCEEELDPDLSYDDCEILLTEIWEVYERNIPKFSKYFKRN